jgi:chromosome segregation ATPase
MVPAMEALQKGGALASAALQREQHGALVEEARKLEEASKHEQEHSELMAGAAGKEGRRGSWLSDAIAGLDEERLEDKVKNHHTQAHSAQSHMKDALSGIQDRGDKINDLGDKTAELEDNAAEYQSLAAQMRQKLEKQNKGLNFLNPFAK